MTGEHIVTRACEIFQVYKSFRDNDNAPSKGKKRVVSRLSLKISARHVSSDVVSKKRFSINDLVTQRRRADFYVVKLIRKTPVWYNIWVVIFFRNLKEETSLLDKIKKMWSRV